MGSYCHKVGMTHAEAQHARANLYRRNNGKKKRGRSREHGRDGELRSYYCEICDAWHVGHWRPREAAGGKYLPPPN